MPRVPEGPPPAPVVQRLRLQYAKRGRLRFSSSRDFQRALERALRRAGVPMAFSAGFHPHPKISYANAAATGTASEAEYVEIGLVERVDPEALRAALDAALPPGLDIVRVVVAGPGALADRLEASVWSLRFAGMPPAHLSAAVESFFALDHVEVTRVLKNGPRTFDVRAAVVRMTVTEVGVVGPGVGAASPSEQLDPPQEVPTAGPDVTGGEAYGEVCAILTMVVRHTTPAVRPDDILTAMRASAGLELVRSPLVTRLAQGPLHAATAQVADPLAT